MSTDFLVDIETLDTQPSCIILSWAAVAVDFDSEFTYDDLVENSVYHKLNARAQRGRTVSQDTLDWWKKQDASVFKEQVLSSPDDLDPLTAYTKLRMFFARKGFDKNKSVVWCRGDLDAPALESFAKWLNEPRLFPYYRKRDVRTAIDLLYGTDNGYCEFIKPLPDNLKKHSPLTDCIIDAWSLKYGKEI